MSSSSSGRSGFAVRAVAVTGRVRRRRGHDWRRGHAHIQAREIVEKLEHGLTPFSD
jgi:hypothetical protein